MRARVGKKREEEVLVEEEVQEEQAQEEEEAGSRWRGETELEVLELSWVRHPFPARYHY